MAKPISYDSKQKYLIHQLLEAIFSGQELDMFCDYYYPALYYRFRPGINSASKIKLLIEYAAQRRQLGKLVGSIENTKPHEYHAFVKRVRAAAKVSKPAASASPRVNLPDRTIRPRPPTDKKRLVPTWALLVILIALLFFASEPLYLMIKPLSADANPTIQKAFIIVERVISRETPDTIQAVPAVSVDEATQAEVESDSDGGQDGLTNTDEVATETVPEKQDTDGDGLEDRIEAEVLKTDPFSPDTDSDGLQDHDEIRLGFDPLRWDTDGDGTSDSTEANPVPVTTATLTPVPIPGPQFKEATYSVNEQDGKATINIHLMAAAESQVIIYYRTTENGTARAGEDYTTVTGQLVFNPGQINGIFTIPIINDGNDEPIETIGLELSGSDQTNLGPNISYSTLMIIDNDEVGIQFSQLQPALTLLQAEPLRYLVSENQQAIIDVELATPADRQIRVSYATQDGSARAGEDYISVNGTLTFSPGQTQMRFSVPILYDNNPEEPEIFVLTLSPETGTDVSRAELVIVDSD